MSLVVYCADIGSVANRRFGWGRVEMGTEPIEEHRGGTEIADFVDAIVVDVSAGHPIAVGFECPLFVPVPLNEVQLGKARGGEGNRSWSAVAGSGALTTGIVQVAWVLDNLRGRIRNAAAFLEWGKFAASESGVFLWEAFVSGRAKGTTHPDDATVAIRAFCAAMPDPTSANALTADRPLSLLGAALLWSGWSNDLALLHAPCLVIKAAP